MELHQRLTNLVQKESNRLLKEFLNDNPDLLQKYVDGGVAVAGAILVPLNAFMRHLLVVKGLDPDTNPGEKQRLELLQAVGSMFDVNHEKDFDEDYDFSWVHKKFEEARKNLAHLGLTKDRFKSLTDLDKLPNIGYGRYPTVEEEQEFFTKQPSTRLPDKELPVTPIDELDLTTKEGRQQFRERALSEFEGSPIDKLRNALKDIIKETADKSELLNRLDKATLSEKFSPADAVKKVRGLVEEINTSSTKKGVKVGKKKVNKGKGTRVNRVQATVEERLTHENKRSTLKESIKAKYNRAKELTDDMVARGLVSDNKDAVQAQLQEILLMNDEAVEALGRVVKNHTSLPTDDKFKGPFRRNQK